MTALLDGNNICAVQKKGNGGGAMPIRLDGNNTCTIQTHTNFVEARVVHEINL